MNVMLSRAFSFFYFVFFWQMPTHSRIEGARTPRERRPVQDGGRLAERRLRGRAKIVPVPAISTNLFNWGAINLDALPRKFPPVRLQPLWRLTRLNPQAARFPQAAQKELP
jgi:hypothetical protein